MITVQYIGKTERTIGTQVAYPGELLQTTPAMLAAWRAEYGDVFVVPGQEQAAPVAEDGAPDADASAQTSKGRRK